MRSPLLAATAVVCLFIQSAAFAQSASPTVEDAEKFIKAAEAELNAESIRVNRIQWVNSTYLTDDTDTLAAEAGAKQTELSVRLALEAAKFDAVPGLSDEAKRKLNILRGGIVLPAPTTAGAATELNNISTKLQSAYGKGEGTLEGQADQRFRHRGADGGQPRSGRAEGDVDELARQGRRADARRLSRAWSRSPMRARRNSATRMSARCGARNTTCRRTTSPS